MSNEMLKDAKKWLSQMHVVLSEQSNQTQIKAVQEKIELVEWLIEQAKQIEKWNDYNNQVIIANVKLKSQNKRYREALEFYADRETYEEVVHEAVYQDGMPIEPPSSEPPLIYLDNYGDIARKVLEDEE